MEKKSAVEIISIIGASRFLGQHVVKHVQLYWKTLKEIRILDDEQFSKKLDYEDNHGIVVKSFNGNFLLDSTLLQAALQNADAVFDFYEYKSYAMFPDDEKFRSINIDGTRFILNECIKAGTVKYFIYGSAFEVMVARDWHSVHNPETAPIPYGKWAFPCYARSKLDAENAVFETNTMQTVAVRFLPMYGELDTESWVFDRLAAAKRANGILTMLGDNENVMQHAYVGNVAYGMVMILQKLVSNAEITKEATFIIDDSPLLDVYSIVKPFLAARKFSVKKSRISFWPFFFAYSFFENIAKIAGKFAFVKKYCETYYSSSYYYTYFYNWVFFKNLKCRLLFDYKPLYSFEQSVKQCENYYANVELRTDMLI